MTSAVPLVHVDDDGRYSVHEEGLRALERSRRPVGLTVVCGRYRGGKSLLLNSLLGAQGAFKVGGTVNSCTRGIWIFPRPMRATSASGEEIDLFVADTEGLGAVDATAVHDSNIFMLSMLLSSLFVFNSVGVIDEHALGQLSLVTRLAQRIRVDPADAESLLPDADGPVAPGALRDFFPAFTWCVRDFALALADGAGRPLTSDAYLEQALRPVPNGDVDKNAIRRVLTEALPERRCFTMVRPCADEAQLQRLADEPIERVARPEFVEQLGAFRAHVLEAARAKRFDGRSLSGAMLGQLARAYVAAINDGAAPVIRSAWSYVCAEQSAAAVAAAHAKAEGRLRAMAGGGDALPRSLELVAQQHAALLRETLVSFDAESVGFEEAAGARIGLLDRLGALLREDARANRARLVELFEGDASTMLEHRVLPSGGGDASPASSPSSFWGGVNSWETMRRRAERLVDSVVSEHAPTLLLERRSLDDAPSQEELDARRGVPETLALALRSFEPRVGRVVWEFARAREEELLQLQRGGASQGELEAATAELERSRVLAEERGARIQEAERARGAAQEEREGLRARLAALDGRCASAEARASEAEAGVERLREQARTQEELQCERDEAQRAECEERLRTMRESVSLLGCSEDAVEQRASLEAAQTELQRARAMGGDAERERDELQRANVAFAQDVARSKAEAEAAAAEAAEARASLEEAQRRLAAEAEEAGRREKALREASSAVSRREREEGASALGRAREEHTAQERVSEEERAALAERLSASERTVVASEQALRSTQEELARHVAEAEAAAVRAVEERRAIAEGREREASAAVAAAREQIEACRKERTEAVDARLRQEVEHGRAVRDLEVRAIAAERSADELRRQLQTGEPLAKRARLDEIKVAELQVAFEAERARREAADTTAVQLRQRYAELEARKEAQIRDQASDLMRMSLMAGK